MMKQKLRKTKFWKTHDVNAFALLTNSEFKTVRKSAEPHILNAKVSTNTKAKDKYFNIKNNMNLLKIISKTCFEPKNK